MLGGNGTWKAHERQRGGACLTSLGPKGTGSSQAGRLTLTSGPLHRHMGQRDGSQGEGHRKDVHVEGDRGLDALGLNYSGIKIVIVIFTAYFRVKKKSPFGASVD